MADGRVSIAGVIGQLAQSRQRIRFADRVADGAANLDRFLQRRSGRGVLAQRGVNQGQIVLRRSDAASIANGPAQFQAFQSAASGFFKRALPPQRETQIAQHIGRAPAITGGAIQRQTGFVVLSGDGEMALHMLHVAEAVERQCRTAAPSPASAC